MCGYLERASGASPPWNKKEELYKRFLRGYTQRPREIAPRKQQRKFIWRSMGKTHWGFFENGKQAVEKAVTLVHSDVKKRFFLYTDASQTSWAAKITQITYEDLEKSHKEQSGHFSGDQSWCPIVEKKSYAIVVKSDRISRFFQISDGFKFFTNHRNLLYIFIPYVAHPGISSHTAYKIVLLGLKISSCLYCIENLSGEDNLWTNLITWRAGRVGFKIVIRGTWISAIFLAPILPFEKDSFTWPSIHDITKSQNSHRGRKADNENVSKSSDYTYKDRNGRMRTPAQDIDLQFCLSSPSMYLYT